ncbi:MAG: DMT family transporter [Novosphingobium sp.]|nr:DMT family transporter [Novosphingobium sp.]
MFALILRLGSAFAISAMLALVKLAQQTGIPLVEIMFWRLVPGAPLILLWLAMRGELHRLKTERIFAHLRRAAAGLTGMACVFGGAILLPLAEATTLNFTVAFWAVILSSLFLKERVGWWRWSAVLLGFLGVIVVSQPGQSPIPIFGAAVALTAAFMVALTSIQIRDLGRTEDPLAIVLYFSAFSSPLLMLSLPFVMEHHTGYQWAILAGIGGLGLVGLILVTTSLRFGRVSSVVVMDYSSLLWATLFGWWIFDNLPPAATWFGAPLIVAAGLIITWREHVHHRNVALGAQGISQA